MLSLAMVLASSSALVPAGMPLVVDCPVAAAAESFLPLLPLALPREVPPEGTEASGVTAGELVEALRVRCVTLPAATIGNG